MDHETPSSEVWKDNTEGVCLRRPRESIRGIYRPEDTRRISQLSCDRQADSRRRVHRDGYIFGKNLELVKGKKIVQEWTTTEWPENYPPSILTLIFQAKPSGTLLTMVH